MRRMILTVFCALSMISLLTSNASAGKAVKLSGVSFSLGSLIAQGTLTGLGSTDVMVVVEGSGIPVVSCSNQGGNQSPGQNPPKVSAVGMQSLFGSDPVRKNGESPFSVETDPPELLSGLAGGCPNDNWTASVAFIYWTDAAITVKSLTDTVLLIQNFTCITTLTTVSCAPVP